MSLPLAGAAGLRLGLRPLIQAARPLLFLDLDGTLAPLVPKPENASVPDSTARIIARLRRGGASVVLVSGRSAGAVARIARFPVDGILGNHGAEALLGGRVRRWLPGHRHIIADAASRIAPVLERWPAARLEDKGRSLAIHFRGHAARRSLLLRDLQGRLLGHPVLVLSGRQVIDIRPRRVDKGRAVARWLARMRPAPAPDAVLYAGDDTTDQDAFHALAGAAVTVAVGRVARGAGFRTTNPATLARWLGHLADARRSRSQSSAVARQSSVPARPQSSVRARPQSSVRSRPQSSVLIPQS